MIKELLLLLLLRWSSLIIATDRLLLLRLEDLQVCVFFDVALDLLKRYSGIVWDPGRFAVLLRGGDVRRLGWAHPPPDSRPGMPGAIQLTVKSP